MIRILPALALAVLTSPAVPVRAQVMIDMSKITCEQYVYSMVSSPVIITAWLSGYYHGKRGNTVVDQQGLQTDALRVDRACRQDANVKFPVMQVINKVLGVGQ